MAGLSTALNFAKAGLATVAGQTAVASRNVAQANNPDYARKQALLSQVAGGYPAIGGYGRASDDLLLQKLLGASSNASAGMALRDGLKALSETVGDPQSSVSPAGMLGKFQVALQLYEKNPADLSLAQNALQAAQGLQRALNQATDQVQSVRRQADADMSGSVGRINALLRQFKAANDAIVNSTGTTAEIAEQKDLRDQTVKLISAEIGVRTVPRANGGIALYTDGGVTLFETVPRSVILQASPAMTAATTGNAVLVDGVDVTSAQSPMAIRSGALFGLARLRDQAAVTYQSQLDEMARGLITAFAEKDQGTPPSLPDAAGLFTASGAAAVPASATLVPGLAGTIRIHAAADPAQGGSALRLRDGGMNGAAYAYNASGAAGFSARLMQLISGIDAPQAFDASAELDAASSLGAFAAQSAGWIEAYRQRASTSVDIQSAIKVRADEALQRVTGVNIDEEMSDMLELERSYQASSKLISAVDAMFQSLLQAAG
jgi:flagellar hook-associated protein 1